jgi:hypothetical protein
MANRATADRRKQPRVIQRVRGELNVDHLAAEGLQIGRGTFVARDAYLDPGHGRREAGYLAPGRR